MDSPLKRAELVIGVLTKEAAEEMEAAGPRGVKTLTEHPIAVSRSPDGQVRRRRSLGGK